MEVVGGLGFRLVMPRSVINAEVRLMEKLERDDDGSGELVAVDVAVGESNSVGRCKLAGEFVPVEQCHQHRGCPTVL